MSNRGWVGQARAAGRLADEEQPWEIVFQNAQRQQRMGFGNEAEALAEAQKIVDEPGHVEDVLVYHHGELVYQLTPDE